MKDKVYFEFEDLEIEYRDSEQWRSYSFSCSGNSLGSCLSDVTVSETDQDGGELGCYGFDEASSEAQEKIVKAIEGKLHS